MQTIAIAPLPDSDWGPLQDFLRASFLFHTRQAELAENDRLKEFHAKAADECKQTLSAMKAVRELTSLDDDDQGVQVWLN